MPTEQIKITKTIYRKERCMFCGGEQQTYVLDPEAQTSIPICFVCRKKVYGK